MTKSIIITYDEADEGFLMTLLQKIKVRTAVLNTQIDEAPLKKGKMSAFEAEQNRKDILAATIELDNNEFHKVSQDELYNLVNQ
jgi:hypothetical protein